MSYKAIATLALLICCSCTTPAPSSYDRLTMFDQSSQAILVFNTSNEIGCQSHEVYFADTSGVHSATSEGLGVIEGSEPAIIVVEAGPAQLAGVSCTQPGYQSYFLPQIADWFEPIEITAGEVVYVGTIHHSKVSMTEQKDAASRAIHTVLFDSSDDREVELPVYDIRNLEQDIETRIRFLYPGVNGPIVTRLLPQRVTPETYRSALSKAFAPTEDGGIPSRELVESRWQNLGMNEKGGPAISTILGNVERARDPIEEAPILKPRSDNDRE